MWEKTAANCWRGIRNAGSSSGDGLWMVIIGSTIADLVVVGTENRPQSLGWCIVEVFCFLPDPILAGICKAALDAALAWPFVS